MNAEKKVHAAKKQVDNARGAVCKPKTSRSICITNCLSIWLSRYRCCAYPRPCKRRTDNYCGDLNGSHLSWKRTERATGGKSVKALINPLQRREPRSFESEVDTRLPSSRGREQRDVFFALRAPHGVTKSFTTKDASTSESSIDLILVSGWKDKLPAIPTILKSPEAFASYHLPILMSIRLRQKQSGRENEGFVLRPIA